MSTSQPRVIVVATRSRSQFLAAAVLLLAGMLGGAACGPPVEEEEMPPEGDPLDPGEPGDPVVEIDPADPEAGPWLQAPGGAYLDIQCRGKHRRHPIKSITTGGGRYVKSGNVETFEHLDTSCNRVEIDTNDHYKTGRHVFEGEVRIGRVTGQSVVQIFDATSSGPIMMIKAYSSGGGTLRKLAGSVTLASGVANKWVRIRIVHDLGPNTMSIDVNGERKWSGNGGRGGGFNLKYGNYGTGAPTDVQWRNASW